jgi:hypothetical protein
MSVLPSLQTNYHSIFISKGTVEPKHSFDIECLIGEAKREDYTFAVAGLDVFSAFKFLRSIFRSCFF